MATTTKITVKEDWRGAPEVDRKLALVVEATAGKVVLGAQKNIERLQLEETYTLLDTIEIKLDGANRFSRFVGTPTDYGHFAEYGTVDEPPYPWLRPAVKAASRFFRAGVAEALK